MEFWARRCCSWDVYVEGGELPCAHRWLLRDLSCAAPGSAYTVQVSARESGTRTLGSRSPKQQRQGSHAAEDREREAGHCEVLNQPSCYIFDLRVLSHAGHHDEQRTLLSAILVGCLWSGCARSLLTTAQLRSPRAIRARVFGYGI